MTQTPLYQTTLSAKARRGLLLNSFAALLLTVLSGFQWYSGGHWLQIVIFCIAAPVAVLVIFTLLRAKHPLQIFENRIVLNSALRTEVPLVNVVGIGTDPKRGTPSLTYRDETNGHSGELAILWRFIREPQEEVLAEIRKALKRSSK